MSDIILWQDTYELQVGLKNSGHDPGPLDGNWGPKTEFAATQMFQRGSLTGSRWAIFEIEEGLRDSGWLDKEEVDFEWSEETQTALGNLIRAKGVQRASFVPDENDEPLVDLDKPPLAKPTGTKSLFQGSHRVFGIGLHTSATPGNWWKGKSLEQIRTEFDRWHRQRGFNMVGYHWIYHPDGSKIAGRKETQRGAHIKGWNNGTLGFCMVPIKTIRKMGKPLDFYTPDQIDAVKHDIDMYVEEYGIDTLLGHNEKANKLCPGFHVIDEEWTRYTVA